MNSEEIKQSHSMREIVESYGIKVNRSGMCCCPFHKEKHPSMKVYKDSCYCFACNKSWDIFSFVMDYKECDFKTAFFLLGGEYERPTKTSQIAIYHAKKQREKRQSDEIKMREKERINNTMIHATRELFNQSEPLSDDWWYYLDLYHMAIIKDINMQEGDRY